MELIQELMETCTSLTKRLLTLEEAKTAQDRVITRLKLRVKRLKKKRKTRTPQPMKRRLFKGRVETSTDKSLGEDASKQGRNDDKIEELNLTDEADTEVIMEDMGSGEKGGSTADQVSTARPKVSAASVPVNISTATPSTPPTTTTIFGDVDLTIAQTLVKMRSENAKEKEKGVVLIDEEEPHRLNRSTITLQPLLTIDPKDKGKGVLVEEEPEKPVKVKRGDQGLAQIESDAELAQRLHEEELAELDKAQKERQKQEEVTSAALAEEFDKIQARIDVDHELVVRLTHEEQEKYTIEERARFQQQAKSTKKRPRADSEEESSKKQKLEEDNDAEKEELRDSIDVVPRDDVAIDNYKIFSEMLDDFDRQDIIDLHRRDGLRAQHLIHCLSGATVAILDELVSSITQVVNLFLEGKYPMMLGEYIASAPLTPLVKPSGGICPIAVGIVWRRLVSKVSATMIGHSLDGYLDGLQFGVGVLGAGEAILHTVNRLVEDRRDDVGLLMLLVDFKNAFNLNSATLPLPDCTTENTPYDRAKGAWYLNDDTIVGDTLVIGKVLELIMEDGPRCGLHLNVDKTEIFWPKEDPRSKIEGVFPPNISRPLHGVKLLGGPVSVDPDFSSTLVMKSVSKTIGLLDVVAKINDT
ncbi:hypothetical protein Tco_0282767 [Tanacetum coccineum]